MLKKKKTISPLLSEIPGVAYIIKLNHKVFCDGNLHIKTVTTVTNTDRTVSSN